jgi:hypothetical protein
MLLVGDLPFEHVQKDANFTLFTKHGGFKERLPLNLLTDSMADLLGSVLIINAAD